VAKRARRDAFAAARPLQVLGWTVAAMIAATVIGLAAFDRRPDPLCATRAQRDLVRLELDRNPRVWLVDLAHDIHLPEAVVMDALPESERVGVAGAELASVWNWLRQQPDLELALHSGRHTWRVRGKLPALRLVERGDWHIGSDDDALSGRISTLDIGVIYGRVPRLANEPAWIVFFLDRDGEVLFQIAPAAARAGDPAVASLAARSLLQRMRGLGPVCRNGRTAGDDGIPAPETDARG
jgi:putative heme iron utilization protein